MLFFAFLIIFLGGVALGVELAIYQVKRDRQVKTADLYPKPKLGKYQPKDGNDDAS